MASLIDCLQVFPDADWVVDKVVGTEASHVVVDWVWSPVELKGDEEDVEKVEAEEYAADGEDLCPHERVNFSNIIY